MTEDRCPTCKMPDYQYLRLTPGHPTPCLDPFHDAARRRRVMPIADDKTLLTFEVGFNTKEAAQRFSDEVFGLFQDRLGTEEQPTYVGVDTESGSPEWLELER